MTTAQLEQRLLALEQAFEEFKRQVSQGRQANRRWWVEDAGRFANDPVFEEIVRLGREYRESLRPGGRKGKRDRS